jgi:hypothetical protein
VSYLPSGAVSILRSSLVLNDHARRFGSWKIACNLLMQHVRFALRLAEKPRSINAARWTHAPQQLPAYSITIGPGDQNCATSKPRHRR